MLAALLYVVLAICCSENELKQCGNVIDRTEN
jgi:hypothetical protein